MDASIDAWPRRACVRWWRTRARAGPAAPPPRPAGPGPAAAAVAARPARRQGTARCSAPRPRRRSLDRHLLRVVEGGRVGGVVDQVAVHAVDAQPHEAVADQQRGRLAGGQPELGGEREREVDVAGRGTRCWVGRDVPDAWSQRQVQFVGHLLLLLPRDRPGDLHPHVVTAGRPRCRGRGVVGQLHLKLGPCCAGQRRQRVRIGQRAVAEAHGDLVAGQVVADQLQLVAQLRAVAGVGRQDLEQGREGWGQVRLRHRPPARVTLAEDRQRGSGWTAALDEDHRYLVGRRDAVLGLEGGPQLRHLLQRQRLVGDADALALVLQVVLPQFVLRQGEANVLRGDHRMVVQDAHRPPENEVAERVLVVLAVGGEQVVQVERQWRRAGLARFDLAGHVHVPPGGAERGVVQEDVELVGGAVGTGPVRWPGCNGGIRRVIPSALAEELAQGGGDGGDRQGIAHPAPPRDRRRRYSSRVTGSGRGTGRLGGSAAGLARTSTRPMVTWMMAGPGVASSAAVAQRAGDGTGETGATSPTTAGAASGGAVPGPSAAPGALGGATPLIAAAGGTATTGAAGVAGGAGRPEGAAAGWDAGDGAATGASVGRAAGGLPTGPAGGAVLGRNGQGDVPPGADAGSRPADGRRPAGAGPGIGRSSTPVPALGAPRGWTAEGAAPPLTSPSSADTVEATPTGRAATGDSTRAG